jgi:hypothetical protein
MGVLIFLLRPHDRMALFTSILLMTFSAANSFSSAPEYLTLVANAPVVFTIPYFVVGMLSFGLLAVFFATFPDGKFVPKWMIWIALEGFLFALAWEFFPDVVGDFSGKFGVVAMLAALVALGGSMIGQVWRYRNYATPLQKQQTKWFIYGLALNVGTLVIQLIVLTSLNKTDPKTSVLYDSFVGVANMSFMLIPLSIGIAILRYRLYDIDLIIRKTLQYGLLTGLLALVYFSSVVLLQSLFENMTGQGSPIVIVISTLAIAALFNPLRRRVQNFIDRRFFRRKYDAEQTLVNFAALTRDEVNMQVLTAAMLAVVEETMQPQGISLWLKEFKRRGPS